MYLPDCWFEKTGRTCNATVFLEDNGEKTSYSLEFEDGGTLMRRCIVCGRPIFRSSNAAKYCVSYAAKERRKRDAARKRKRRLDVRKSGL